ncbi:MAG: glycosyltransferase family 4 protein [Candidatus Harrisonbacteria bacterium]|nr:glycosyltransferase family 4 protein [Candidatus Harrisonbacteria bacterium]
MKVLMISIDKGILDRNTPAGKRMKEYSELFDELVIIVFAKKGKGSGYENGRLKVFSSDSLSKVFYFWDAWKIIRRLRINKDWVITSQDPYETGLFALLVKWWYKVPLEMQIHVDIFSPYFKHLSFRNRFRAWLAKQTLPFATRVRAVASRVKQSIIDQKLLLPEKITVIPVPTNNEEIRKKSSAFSLKEKYPGFAHYFLIVSRLAPEKNIPLAIEAFAEVIQKYPEAFLLIVGKGSEENSLKKLVFRLKLEKNICFESWTSDPFSYMKTADIFLLPSLYEGWGLSAIESLACGLPIIMTDVGCAGEVVRDGKNGLIVPVADKIALQKAMEKVIKDSSLLSSLKAGTHATDFSRIEKPEILKALKENLEKTAASFLFHKS